MSGRPLIPSPNSFGPKLRNKYPVDDPESDVDAKFFNLVRWQVAGDALTGCTAWVLFDSLGVPIEAEEAFDPERQISPTVTRTGTGVYTVEYPATATDEDGNAQPIVLYAGKPFPQSTDDLRAVCRKLTSRKFEIKVRNAAGAATDVETYFEVR